MAITSENYDALEVNALALTPISVNASTYTCEKTDGHLSVTTDQATTITLPSALADDEAPKNFSDGHMILIKDVSGNAELNNITIEPAPGETVHNKPSISIRVAYGSVFLASDGVDNWTITSSYGVLPIKQDVFSLTHAASVSSYDKLYLLLENRTKQVTIISDRLNTSSDVHILAMSSGEMVVAPSFKLGATTIPVYRNTLVATDSDCAPVYIKPLPGNLGQLQSDVPANVTGNPSDSDSDTMYIIYDTAPAEGAYAVTYDVSGNALYADTKFTNDLYIFTENQIEGSRKYKVENGTTGVQLYYNSNLRRFEASIIADDVVDSVAVSDYLDSGSKRKSEFAIIDLYFDEDADDADRLLHGYAYAPFDLLIQVAGDKYLKVKYDASASSNGVPIYSNGSMPSATIYFTSPTTSSASLRTHDTMAPGVNGIRA